MSAKVNRTAVITKTENEIEHRRNQYGRFYEKAEFLLEGKRNLDEALKQAGYALDICPKSPKARNLQSKISDEIAEKELKQSQRRAKRERLLGKLSRLGKGLLIGCAMLAVLLGIGWLIWILWVLYHNLCIESTAFATGGISLMMLICLFIQVIFDRKTAFMVLCTVFPAAIISLIAFLFYPTGMSWVALTAYLWGLFGCSILVFILVNRTETNFSIARILRRIMK